ncbi:MAG: tryptophan 2,3-dioxygenase [Chitinophagales bacterium]|jgi:tryptophan 2,3-dioxygenase|nr:tryptophan 2,3-dioxygenase [Chitinophagales bacterium]
MSQKYAAIHYASYLQLDKILGAQKSRSAEFGKEAQDEHLFIVVHQVYELWFKQIIHDLKAVYTIFAQSKVQEQDLSQCIHLVERSISIFKLMVQQIEVLETMTPMDFLEFRNYLFPASGFQSFQFRICEVMLGLKNKYRITYNNYHYHVFFDEAQKKELDELENAPSLLELMEQWLERMPFLEMGDFNFLDEYQEQLKEMLALEKKEIQETPYLDEHMTQIRLKMLGDAETFYQNIFDKTQYQQKLDEGEVRISYRAMLSILFISLYRHEPMLQLPYQLIVKFSELDEFISLWRFRHTQMVKRTIGQKIGTGGSSGADYLLQTTLKHAIFSDFYHTSTLMIPRNHLPILPEEIRKKLNFLYT